MIGCSTATLSQLAKMYPAQAQELAQLVHSVLQKQLDHRIAEAAWENDASNEGNGSSSFIPPCVKARHLKYILHDYAEVHLKHVDETTCKQQKQAAQDKIEEEDSFLVFMKDDPDFINELSKEPEVTKPRSFDGVNKDESNEQLESNQAKKLKNNKVLPVDTSIGASSDVSYDDKVGSKNGDINETKITNILRANLFLEKDVWPAALQNGFIRPILQVLQRFLESEIKAAAWKTHKLNKLCTRLMEGFQGIYTAIEHEIELKDKQQLKAFNQVATQIEQRIPSKPSQPYSDLVDLYLACYQTQPFFHKFIDNVVRKTKAMEGSGVGPLKKMYRAFEKMAFRGDGKQWSADCVLDIVRGSLIFDNMRDIANCLEFIDKYELVEIVRIKNRFKNPNGGGWRDCMLNIVCVKDPERIVCEVQIIHRNLMLARKGMAGHNDYTTYRSGVELQEAVRSNPELLEESNKYQATKS
jgi:hypothetical protein